MLDGEDVLRSPVSYTLTLQTAVFIQQTALTNEDEYQGPKHVNVASNQAYMSERAHFMLTQI